MVVCDFVIVVIDQKRPKKINIGGIDVYSTNRNSLMAPKQYAGGFSFYKRSEGCGICFLRRMSNFTRMGFVISVSLINLGRIRFM